MTLLPLIAAALAAPAGVLVRVDAGADPLATPVVARVAPDGGEPVDVTLLDDGTSPDVTKGDGQWTGVGIVDGDSGTLSLVAGGKTLGTAPIAFSGDAGPRDVDAAWKNGALTATASTGGTGQPASQQPTPPADPAVGATPPVDPTGATVPEIAPGASALPDASQAGAPGASQPRAGGVSFPDGQPQPADDGTLWIGLGVGLLVLLGAAWMWTRTRQAPAARPSSVTLVPEPGLLGPGSPSLSDGLAVWVAAEGEERLVQALVSHLADRHRVLVAARSDVSVRPVAGGPVYRLAGVKPSQVGDAAEALAREDGPPLAVLIVADGDATALRDYASLLPGDVGGVALVPHEADVPLARVHLRPAGEDAWEVQLKDGVRRVRATDAGFELVAS
jgi:hypothetical protein